MAMPALDRAKDAFEQAREEQDFWEKNYQRFLELYPDKFVAVSNAEVIVADEDLQKIIQLIEAKGLELANVKIRFVTANPQFLLL